MDFLISILLIGAGATLVTDFWAIARKRLIGVPMPDFGLVGRWFAHMARGRFRHEAIYNAGRLQITPLLKAGGRRCHLTSAISGGAQSARRLLCQTSGTRSQFLQAA